MAVPEQTPYSEHISNGITTGFPLGFNCKEKIHLIVLVDDVEPPIASWSLVDGNVVFTSAPAVGKKIVLKRNTPLTRTTNYQSANNSFRPETINLDMDQVWLKLQEFQVLDWLKDRKFSNLNEETRAEFLQKIQEQGISLSQIDLYQKQLFSKLINTAVNNNWLSDFIAYGNKTQKQFNDEINANILDQLIRNDQIINLVSDFKAIPGTDCTTNIYNAILEALKTGKALYTPSATLPYLYRASQLRFYLDEVPISASKSLYIYGDGESSCFKLMDGEINQAYSFSIRFEPRLSMKSFYFKQFKIDNNARGSTTPPEEDRFKHEQSHTLSFAGGLESTYIDSITYDNMVIEDPAADGYSHSLAGYVENITYINPIERGRTRVRSSIQEYYRAKNVTIINPQVHSIETEAVRSPAFQSNLTILGGSSEVVDLTTNAYNDNVNVTLDNHINTKKFNVAGVRNFNVIGGQLAINKDWPRIQGVPSFSAIKAKILIPYDPAGGTLYSLRFFKSAGQKVAAEFDQCSFMIDHVGLLPFTPSDSLISNATGTGITTAEIPNQVIKIKNSKFDERALGSVNAFRMGTVVLENNEYGGTDHAIRWHTSAGAGTDLTVKGGDFSKITGVVLRMSGISEGHKLTLSGEWIGLKASSYAMISGSISAIADNIKNYRTIVADSLPTVALAKDVFKVGTAAATVGTVIEYQCTASSATAPTFICSKQLGMYEAATASPPPLTSKEKFARALDTTSNSIKTWTGTAWI
ncbi:MAG: hypothetical protein ACRC4N_16785 [Gammaproteobacteria bacterium]